MTPRLHTALSRAVVRPVHPHQWLWEPLQEEPSFVLRAMFGAKAVYLGGKLMLCFCAGEDPWRGVLICTDRERQTALRDEFPVLEPHAILPKWLYLPEKADGFETIAERIVALARRLDPRLGVVPGGKKKAANRRARRRSRNDHP